MSPREKVSGVRPQWRRVRTIIAAGAVALVAAGALSACQSNVGVAARVDGQTISETTVGNYFTPQAEAYSQPLQDGTTQHTDVRPFVLGVLISVRLYTKILGQTTAGAPSENRLDSLASTALMGRSPVALATQNGVRGYTEAFDRELLRLQELGILLQRASQSGADINTIAERLSFPVSVNPRYGAWNPKTFSLDSTASAGLPKYLQLQAGGAG